MKKALLLVIGSMLATLPMQGQGLQGRTFVYGEEVKLAQPLQIDTADHRPLQHILDEVLKGSDIDYRITERHVLLFRRKQAETTPTPCTLHGYVTDSESGETLIGANVYCPALGAGTVSNAYGFYSMPMARGRQAVVISYVGYEPLVTTIDITGDVAQNYTLQPAQVLQEVVVESDRPETGAASTRMSASTISIQQIQQMPSMLGESDVLKSLQILPGVQTGFAGTSQLSVRGGNLDQNLFLLDGIMLYNVHHVLGFESAFMPDAVKHVDFFRGSFPARYGGRLSSVADVRTKDGDMQHYHGLFSIGLLSSHLELEGPIIKDRTSFMVSARRSYIDWLIKLGMRLDDSADDVDKLSLYFYDLNAKVNHKFSDTDRLFLSFYQGQDGLKVAARYGEHDSDRSYTSGRFAEDLHWGNTFGCVRWNHLFSPQLFSNLTVGYNSYRLLSDGANAYREFEKDKKVLDNKFRSKFSSGIDDFMAIYDFDYHPAQQHHIKFGGAYTLHTFHPEVQSTHIKLKDEENEIDNHYSSGNRDMHGNEFALYAEDDMTLSDRWQVNAGVRGVLYTVDGKCYPDLEPRLSASYLLTRGLRMKAAYTMMHQYVLQLTTSQINMPTDLWVSVTKEHVPMVANQFAVGLSCDRWQGWELTMEGYYKNMEHVLEYIDGASFSGSSKGWQDKVTQGNGRCYGLELGATRNIGRTTGTLSYTWSKSDRCFPNGAINNGKRYPYEYDRRHVFHILLQHQFTKHVDFNACWNYASGGYATISQQTTQYLFPNSNADNYNYSDGHIAKTVADGDYYSSRNNFRMKSRQQLDLSINIHHTTKHGERIWNFSLMNAYFYRNQDLVWTEQKQVKVDVPDPLHPGQTVKEKRDCRVLVQATVIPILPSASYTYKF